MKLDEIKVDRIEKVAVIGLGTIGGELFKYFNENKIDAYGVDIDEKVRNSFGELNSRIYPEIKYLRELGIQATIECVPEDYGIKKEVWLDINQTLSDNCVFMLASSSFPSRKFSECVSFPESLMNAHVLPDFYVRKLVEFQTSGYTSDAYMKQGIEFFEKIGFDTVKVKGENPGFLFNRVWHDIVGYSLEMANKPEYSVEDIEFNFMKLFNCPYGCFAGMDFVGLDTLESVAKRTGIKLPEFVEDMVEKGELGVKTGKGFFEYSNTNRKKQIAEYQEKLKDFGPSNNKIKYGLTEIVCNSANVLVEAGQDKEEVVKAIQKGLPTEFNPFERN